LGTLEVNIMLSFDWLIAPVSADTFFKDYYEKQPLLIEGCDPDKFKSVVTLEEIDRYLATSTPTFPDVFLVDASRDSIPSRAGAFPAASTCRGPMSCSSRAQPSRSAS
jgi:hypothetical protein